MSNVSNQRFPKMVYVLSYHCINSDGHVVLPSPDADTDVFTSLFHCYRWMVPHIRYARREGLTINKIPNRDASKYGRGIIYTLEIGSIYPNAKHIWDIARIPVDLY